MPPWGGAPYLKAFVRKPNCFSASSAEKPQYAEHFLLELRVENTDRASADLNAVHDEIVGIGTDATRIGVHQREVLALGRRERMVHRIVTLRLVIPFEQREIDDPQRREPVVGTKSEPLAHFQP